MYSSLLEIYNCYTHKRALPLDCLADLVKKGQRTEKEMRYENGHCKSCKFHSRLKQTDHVLVRVQVVGGWPWSLTFQKRVVVQKMRWGTLSAVLL